MPNYSFKCIRCEKQEDKRRSIDDRNNPVVCSCGYKMVRQVECPAWRPDMTMKGR